VGAALQDLCGDTVECTIVDVLEMTNVPLIRSSPRLYDHLSTRWLPVYDAGYRLTNRVWRVNVISRLVYLQARRTIVRALRSLQPRLVVVTHPLTQRFLGVARRTYRLPFRIVTVVTDLVSLHASWTYTGVDLCVVPTDESYHLMRRRGMPAERMIRTGFPVHPKFVRYEHEKEAARRELRLDDDRFTILVTSGGVGSGRLHELVVALERAYSDRQILVVTGKNQALCRELQSQPRSRYTHIYGFVDNMEALMAASDVIVTKAGPGTLMEALVMRRPVIVTEAVGMQEHGNIDFVRDHELGFFCPTTERIVAAVHDLSDPASYATKVENLRDAVPRDGAIQIANILQQQLEDTDFAPAAPLRKRARLPRLSRKPRRRS
jgi:UDP-N-acetylglucosamine:LPS N-acetylglucosamine transferase